MNTGFRAWLSELLSLMLLALLLGVIVWGIDLLAWNFRGHLILEIELPPLIGQYWA